MDTLTILGLEWHRWLFFFLSWVPWLLVEIWYYKRMKKRFRDRPGDVDSTEGSIDDL